MNNEDWEQTEVIHCPDRNCRGMLLSNPKEFYLKCGECEKNWVKDIEYREVIVKGKKAIEIITKADLIKRGIIPKSIIKEDD